MIGLVYSVHGWGALIGLLAGDIGIFFSGALMERNREKRRRETSRSD